MDVETAMDSRRKCSHRHCVFLFLVLIVVFVGYISNTMLITNAWNSMGWFQHSENETSEFWANLKKKLGKQVALSEKSLSTTGIHSTEGARATSRLNSTDGARINGTTTSATSPPEQITHTDSTPPTSPPLYVSPGPYLVEYPSEYHFTINQPRICEEEKPFLVLMVPVAPKNRAHRDVIRSTWGRGSLVLDKVVKLFFLLGLYTGEGHDQLQEQVQQESGEHRDLIQSNFVDCYKNLTIKTMVMLEWLDTYCSSVAYAMKIDSDMFLNVPNLIKMLADAPKTNYMTGLVVKGAAVLRNKNSKWYVPPEIYPKPEYPCYALGLGYVLSLDLPKKLVDAAKHVKAVYIEDVYLGMCMKHLGIPPTNPPNWNYFHVFPLQYSRCAYSKIIATTTHEDTDRVQMWKDFNEPGPYCE